MNTLGFAPFVLASFTGGLSGVCTVRLPPLQKILNMMKTVPSGHGRLNNGTVPSF